MTINTAEKIEIIVQCSASGTFGTFTEYAPGKFRVEADGLTVLVRCGVHGWLPVAGCAVADSIILLNSFPI